MAPGLRPLGDAQHDLAGNCPCPSDNGCTTKHDNRAAPGIVQPALRRAPPQARNNGGALLVTVLPGSSPSCLLSARIPMDRSAVWWAVPSNRGTASWWTSNRRWCQENVHREPIDPMVSYDAKWCSSRYSASYGVENFKTASVNSLFPSQAVS